MLDAAVDDRAQAFHRSADLEGLEALEQEPVDDLDLDAREQRPHAEVLAEPERQMRVGATVDAERERVVEHLLVAVRRREVEGHLVAGSDRLAAERIVLGGDAGEVADRADPPQDLLHRIGHQLGTGAQLLPLGRMLAERQQTAADGVAGGLVARLDQQLAVEDELLPGERPAVDLGVDQVAHQVVLRGAPALLDQPVEVGVHLAARPFDRPARRLARPPVLGVVLTDHLVRPPEQQRPVLTGHAEERRDHRQREGAGDALDEVELARRARRRRSVEDVDGDALELRTLPAHAARRETGVGGPPQGPVPRRIDHHDQVGGWHDDSGPAQVDPLGAREAQRLLGDLHDVGVLGDRPEGLVPLRREVGDGRLGPQSRPHLVRIPVARVPRRVDQIEHVDGDRHRVRGSLGRPSRRSPTIVRWISLVPPMIELARDASRPSAH